MRCLTPAEVSTWLNNRRIVEAPAEDENDYARVPCGYNRCNTIEFVLCECFAGILGEGPFLIHVFDAAHGSPRKMIMIDAFRAGYGESRSLGDAPGHEFHSGESDAAVSLFCLCAAYQWSCYLYSATDATLLNWKGQLFDFWTTDAAKQAKFRKLLKDQGFSDPSVPFS